MILVLKTRIILKNIELIMYIINQIVLYLSFAYGISTYPYENLKLPSISCEPGCLPPKKPQFRGSGDLFLSQTQNSYEVNDIRFHVCVCVYIYISYISFILDWRLQIIVNTHTYIYIYQGYQTGAVVGPLSQKTQWDPLFFRWFRGSLEGS